MSKAADLCGVRRELTEAEIRTVINGKRNEIQNRSDRKRWANDPEYRAKRADQKRKYGPACNESRRKRYRNDPEYRAKCMERSREYYRRKIAREG